MGIIMNLEEVATLVLVECPREVIFHPCEVFRQDHQMETSTRDKISTNIVLEDVLASSGWILDTAEKNLGVNFSIPVLQDDLKLMWILTWLLLIHSEHKPEFIFLYHCFYSNLEINQNLVV